MVAEEKANQITKLLISSTSNCLVDPNKVLYLIAKSYPIRLKFIGWNRILDIVIRSLKELDFDIGSLEIYYDKSNGENIK